MKSSRLGGLAVACLLTVGGTPLEAQSPRGAVEGRVVTDIGEPLAAAEITLTPSPGNGVRRTETDRSGTFRIGFLAEGQYVLTVRRIGYRPAEPLLVTVQGGDPVRLTVPMEPVAVAIDSLVTSAPRVSITRTDTEFGTRLTARELAILPTFNDARLLVAFTPGARPDQIWGAASAQANQYQLDGITVNHPGVGGDFVQPSVTWIQDLEVR
ncbi:MAG TPA: carboxypeptidase-like regulatory domain-containing protein, partial [Gemmatimonadales bacterium]|nr:carboxypeptidase-like regulatory domain-containing protein [Gemmatimonadales bacterium]